MSGRQIVFFVVLYLNLSSHLFYLFINNVFVRTKVHKEGSGTIFPDTI